MIDFLRTTFIHTIFTLLIIVLPINLAFGANLHVGDSTIEFALYDPNAQPELPDLLSSGVPRTEHALFIRDNNDNVYFTEMVPARVPNTIHTIYQNEVYSACRINTYWWCITDDGLYWADPNLYLESKNTQYINTLWVPTVNTAVEIVMADTSDLTYSLFGVKNGVLSQNSGFGILLENGKFGFFRNKHSIEAIPKDNNFHYYYLSNTDAILDDTHYDFPSADEPINISRPMFAFGFNHVGAAYDKAMRIKYIKIYESGTLVRHLVPVTSGLVIGNYTVPSDGMWDIVGQVFYGNSGTGSFSVSRDGGLM